MTALWARLEPLLGQVQKPARYIGCEDGAVIPTSTSLALGPDGTRMVAELATVGRGSRPAGLAAVAFPGAAVEALRARRTHQWIGQHDEDRRPPLSDERVVLPDAVPAPLVGA